MSGNGHETDLQGSGGNQGSGYQRIFPQVLWYAIFLRFLKK